MRILSIETSCDETAIAVVEAEGDERAARFRVLGNALLSQVEVHTAYGGVFPALAKREHAKNLTPLLEAALEEAELLREDTQEIPEDSRAKIATILARESVLAEQFFAFIAETEPPAIDVIAVTAGPGLEPALWVGVNFARALAFAWEKPIIAVNHLEGHILAALARELASSNYLVPTASDTTRSELVIAGVEMPVLVLLISGGHTELVLMKKWLEYELLGQTRDDAVGEAFDKVARMLGLPYPGGPELSRLAEEERQSHRASMDIVRPYILPRPMIDSGDCDFSFAGLKTAVLYLLKNGSGKNAIPKNVRSDILGDSGEKVDGDGGECDGDEKIRMRTKMRIAHEFENAVADVLWKKTARALADSRARTLVIGGGVSANTHIRRVFAEKIAREYPAKTAADDSLDAPQSGAFGNIELRIPAASLTTDNAVMIALAGFYRALRKEFAHVETLRADGNLALSPRERARGSY